MRLPSAFWPIRPLLMLWGMRRRLAIVAALSTLLAAGAGASTCADAAPETGYLSAPTDQIAVPGMPAAGEITPEGDLYTGWAEYELRFGRRLTPWNQPTRTLSNPSLPLLSSTLSVGRVSYTQTIFAVPVGGRPVAYLTVAARNGSNHPREAQVAMLLAYTRGRGIRGPHGVMTGAFRYERPVHGTAPGSYEQPGQPFAQDFAYSVAGRDLDRSGLLLARGPAAGSRPLTRPALGMPTGSQGRPALRTLTASHDGRLFTARLGPHGGVSLTWQIPLSPPPAGPGADRALDGVGPGAALAELRGLWGAQETGMMGISVPEAKVSATYRAAIAQILSSRSMTPAGWEQSPNLLQYRSFWIRDAAIESQALDLAGLHAAAAQNLSFMDAFQEPDGLFISQAGQYDGLGEALWALSQHAQLTQDPAYAAAQLTRIAAAVQWLSAATAGDPLGLLPTSNPNDNELAYGHITGDDLWAAAGLRSAIADAALAGAEGEVSARGDVAAWRAIDQRFESSLDRAIAAAVARVGHIPPVLDAAGGQDWGNYWAAFPVQVLGADSPAVTATLAWARTHMSEGLPTYLHGRELHDYLGFRIFQTELAAGDAKDAIAGLYAELAHTTSTDEGWETGIAPFGGRASATNLSPHGTFAAEYVALLRDMLVMEDPAGSVALLAGASPAWLGPGGHITLTAAPTGHGVISFTERSTRSGETLTWQSTLAPGTPLKWVLPGWARNARTRGRPGDGGAIALHGDSGSLTVTFDGRRPDSPTRGPSLP